MSHGLVAKVCVNFIAYHHPIVSHSLICNCSQNFEFFGFHVLQTYPSPNVINNFIGFILFGDPPLVVINAAFY